jgi:hypothetical protein
MQLEKNPNRTFLGLSPKYIIAIARKSWMKKNPLSDGFTTQVSEKKMKIFFKVFDEKKD